MFQLRVTPLSALIILALFEKDFVSFLQSMLSSYKASCRAAILISRGRFPHRTLGLNIATR